jgi:simple sugar transport system permease protein
MLKLEPRAHPSAWMTWLSPVLAVLLTMACGVVLFTVVGKDPLASLAVFFLEPIKDLRGWSEVGVKLAPLLLISVGLAMCFRANVFNIGAEGQLALGAITAGAVVLYFDDDTAQGGFWLISLALFAGVAGGMLWAAITAFLRDRYNANEILVSLMLVYVAELLLSYLVHGALMDPDGFGFPQSRLFSDGFLLPIVLPGTRLHPIGVIFSSFIMALLYIGGELSQSRLGMPSAITGIFQGILLFSLLACDVLIHNRLRWRR